MINKLKYIRTENTYPYRNLAMEEYLTMHAAPGECILFLWQNRRTVVVGKNQNCWKECNVSRLEADGGYLVRRLAGGGAVYHDLGNLNFTFCVNEEDYDLPRQMDVICRAVRSMGIDAVPTGRNDITVDGRKFSGNAFLNHQGHCYHHGTLMLSVDQEDLNRYLTVDREKLVSKGIDSVRGRVICLRDLKPDLGVDEMASALQTSFSEVYGLPVEQLSESSLPAESIQSAEDRFASPEWKYGRRIPFQYEISRRFPWGDFRLQLSVNKGLIEDASISSDAMDQNYIDDIASSLIGCPHRAADMAEAVRSCILTASRTSSCDPEQMKADVAELIVEKV